MDCFDYTVVGAGIVGLATAYQLQCREPRARVAVVNKELSVASHQTGHNSGVLHAGLYYRPGSLKARLCREGKAELERYAAERGIPYLTCGKVIVAVDEEELPRLEELARRGIENGLQGIRRLSARELTEIEPHVRGLAGIHVPETGVIDYRLVARSLEQDIVERGGQVLLGRKVVGVEQARAAIQVSTQSGSLQTRKVVFCGGLHSDRLGLRGADAAGARHDDLRIVPFRGSYYELSDEAASLVKALIYPVPPASYPFLGVHFTRHIDGKVTAGPNAVLAFAREGYGRSQVKVRDLTATLGFPGFWRLARKYWRTGLAEQWRDLSKAAFVRELQRYVPELDGRELRSTRAGVRAQAVDRGGSLLDDFVLDGRDGVLHVRNAPSPAATSSLAIGRALAERLTEMS